MWQVSTSLCVNIVVCGGYKPIAKKKSFAQGLSASLTIRCNYFLLWLSSLWNLLCYADWVVDCHKKTLDLVFLIVLWFVMVGWWVSKEL